MNVEILIGLGLSCIILSIYIQKNPGKPLFPMKCKYCGKLNRNWLVMPTGGDNFAWRHRCDK